MHLGFSALRDIISVLGVVQCIVGFYQCSGSTQSVHFGVECITGIS